MIQISQCKMPVGHSAQDLENKIRKLLRLKVSEPFTYEIRKKSIDARKKTEVYLVYQLFVSLDKEQERVAKLHQPSIAMAKEVFYHLPEEGAEPLELPPVVIGMGPAGLFAAYLLAERGYQPIVIERGQEISKRKKKVELFWETGTLCANSNVQFGEGGAGTFSDGKLNTAVKDAVGRIAYILETFVKFGAPENICYDAKPHIGTDILSEVIVNMRKYMVDKGCRFLFETQVEDFEFEETADGRRVSALCLDANGQKEKLPVSTVILAPGHSARDTFEMLQRHAVLMTAKNFAVGFRVEHPQSMIDTHMYGAFADRLPPAPYKLTSNFPNGRGVYSFCMCPGGYVVNSSSEEMQTVVNGMSYSGRDGKNANSAIIVSVTEEDFGATDALAGMRYQMRLEKECYRIGNGKIPQQLFGDFCDKKRTVAYGSYESQTKGETVFADLRGLLSPDMESSFIEGMHHFGKIIPSFDRKDAILSGIESRTSSPVRIVRDEQLQSNIRGLYPCGEGAGYAGGIVSAAADGMKAAEAIIKKYCRTDERGKTPC